MAGDDVWNIETCSENWKAFHCFICANKTIGIIDKFSSKFLF